MENENNIDKKRSSSGSIDIGTEEDGAILEMPTIKGRHLIIKERSIYELITADQVDPERKNSQIPNMFYQLIFGQGVESAIVSRIFMTAKTLFRSQFFDSSINVEDATLLSLDAVKEFGELENNINAFLDAEKIEIIAYEKRRQEGVTSYSLPAITNIETRCKTIFQKAYQIEQLLMEIIVIFFPNDRLHKQSHFSTFQEIIKNKFGEEDSFYKFLDRPVYFIRIIRSLRNALDHRLSYITINDFDIQSDGTVYSPTIEYKDDSIIISRQELASFLKLTIKNMLYIFEHTVAQLSAKMVKQDTLHYQLREIPEAERHNKYIRFSFWSGSLGFFFH